MEKEKITGIVSGLVQKSLETGGQTIKTVSFKPAVYLNGQLLGQFDRVLDSLLSPTGKNYAVAAKISDRTLMYREGVLASDINSKYSEIALLEFSPDEKRLLWIGSETHFGSDLCLDGLLLGHIGTVSAEHARNYSTYAFSPDSKSVVWIKHEHRGYGFDRKDFDSIMINQEKKCELKGWSPTQILWLENNRLVILSKYWEVKTLKIGKEGIDEKCEGEFVRIIASPDKTDFAIVKRERPYDKPHSFAVVYKGRVYYLRRKLDNESFEQTQIKIESKQLVVVYPDAEVETTPL